MHYSLSIQSSLHSIIHHQV